MARSIWSGTISFGQLAIPVELCTAVRDACRHERSAVGRIGGGRPPVSRVSTVVSAFAHPGELVVADRGRPSVFELDVGVLNHGRHRGRVLSARRVDCRPSSAPRSPG